MLDEDEELRDTAVEVGFIDREWFDHPGEHKLSTTPPLEVTRRLLERAVERKPSVLKSLGLKAIDSLSWDLSFDRAPNSVANTTAAVTVLFTDVEGFTPYTAENGDSAALEFLDRHHRSVMPVIRGRGGRVVKRLGDGLMLLFPNPTAAVYAATELVRIAPDPLRLRAGAHIGEAVITGDDVLGHVVNIAARVTDQAEGGQALVSGDVYTAVGSLSTIRFTGPWTRELKGIDEPISVYQAEAAAN
jgi:adenylate cyclase